MISQPRDLTVNWASFNKVRYECRNDDKIVASLASAVDLRTLILEESRKIIYSYGEQQLYTSFGSSLVILDEFPRARQIKVAGEHSPETHCAIIRLFYMRSRAI